jgi:hypothetical protein
VPGTVSRVVGTASIICRQTWSASRRFRQVDGSLSIRFTEHLALEAIGPSIGSVGDTFNNALMDTMIGFFKTACSRTAVFQTGPTRPLRY